MSTELQNLIVEDRLKDFIDFSKKHPDCSTAPESWYLIVKRTFQFTRPLFRCARVS